jgi:hypothetical protein
VRVREREMERYLERDREWELSAIGVRVCECSTCTVNKQLGDDKQCKVDGWCGTACAACAS